MLFAHEIFDVVVGKGNFIALCQSKFQPTF